MNSCGIVPVLQTCCTDLATGAHLPTPSAAIAVLNVVPTIETRHVLHARYEPRDDRYGLLTTEAIRLHCSAGVQVGNVPAEQGKQR